MKKVLVGLLIVVCSAGLLGKFWLNNYLSQELPIDKSTLVTVEKGESLSVLAHRLKKMGYISSPRVFSKIGHFLGYAEKFKFGEYELLPNMTKEELYKLLTTGKMLQYSILLTEGSNIFHLAEILEKKGLGKKEDILKMVQDPKIVSELVGENQSSLEGYLFPDSYFYQKGDSAKNIIRKMTDRFKEVYKNLPAGESKMTRHQLVTLASIIEKETGAVFERPLISSVFHNRLKKNMRLETDPTVIYGVLMKTGKLIKNIKRIHLREPTPFNTYTNKGLPPGPIGNPGRQAILAAIRPEKSQNLFFVSKNDGTHVFTQTYKDHLKAVKYFQMNPKMRQGKSWRDLKQKKIQ